MPVETTGQTLTMGEQLSRMMAMLQIMDEKVNVNMEKMGSRTE